MRAVMLLTFLFACTKGDDAADTDPTGAGTDPSGTSQDPNGTNGTDGTDGTDGTGTTEGSWDYVLFSPIGVQETYLIQSDGQTVHTWANDRGPGQSVYLLEDGDLLRTGSVPTTKFLSGGAGGSVQRIDWDGNVTWEFEYANTDVFQHHDARILPSGNVVMIAWDAYSQAELVALGRDPTKVGIGGSWLEHLVEVDPDTNEIVWEWHVADHLVQDRDPAAANYVADLADAPGRLDIDYLASSGKNDWLHMNALDYNPELDQLIVSIHNLSEFWILDHATTSAEAAGAAGDFLFRWGNPATTGGAAAGQELYVQHNVQWIDEGLPGAGNLLIFDNGDPGQRPWTRIVELTPPLLGDGSYALDGDLFAEPDLVWEYTAPNPEDFFADFISGAQRQPDGSTLICDGPEGRFFGVTEAGDEVWSFDYGGITFRAERYPADFAGLAGKTLTPSGDVPSGGGGGGGGPGGGP